MQLSHKVWSRGWPELSSRKLLALGLFVSLALAVGYRFTNRSDLVEVSRTFPVLGTFATVIVTIDPGDTQIAFHKADSLLTHLDTQLGRFSETGQLYHLNTTYGISAGSELADLIRRSDTLVRATNSSFDPTLGILSRIWGFPEPISVPDSTSVIDALSFTGWATRVHIDEDTITIEPGTEMDFGAIAKGHAVDRTFELLMDMGASECLVEVGGEVRCGSLTGRIWFIGVRHPRIENLSGVLAIESGAVATSGDYECFFIEDGTRYSHLLDSNTGFPSRNSLSATVFAGDCATADAMATAAAVAGPEEAALFPLTTYTGMLIITEDINLKDYSIEHEFGVLPWAE